jgi:glutamate N-acetyltransferase/amino-acid N-acetyltransferase
LVSLLFNSGAKMKMKFKKISGSIVAPKGFRASGVFCNIKKIGTGKGSNKGPKRDLAFIVSETPATVAGMFTTNQVCAAPVKVCVDRMKRGTAQAVVVNSGNANACTGKQGMADAREMVSLTERALNFPKGSALVGSTGRIGVTMPMDNVRAGIIEAATLLGGEIENADRAAEAIMTSDSHRRYLQRRGHDSARHESDGRATGDFAAWRPSRDNALFYHDGHGN